MNCSVLQKNPEPPTLDQLKQAFRSTPGLTEYDAAVAHRDAFGIIARGLPPERAGALKNSLATAGVPAEVLGDTQLPQLPDTFFLARLDCTEPALLLHDSLGRIAELPWANILLIAAGIVPMSEFKDANTNTKQWIGLSADQRGGLQGKLQGWLSKDGWAETQRADHWGAIKRTHPNLKEEHHNRLLLEIILVGGAVRYSINSANALPQLFAGLGDRRTNDPLQNFALLIQGLLQGAPHAATNHGARLIAQNDFKYTYPGKPAFGHEIIWLLWQNSLHQPPTLPSDSPSDRA